MSTARCLRGLAALLAVTPLAAQDSQPQKHLLRYAFEKGDVAHCALTGKSVAKITVRGQPMDQDSEVKMHLTMEVTGTDGERTQVASKLTRIEMDTKNPMMQIKFDTADEDSIPPAMGPVLDLIGEQITSQLTPRGEHSIVEASEQFANPRTAAMGLDPAQMIAQFRVTLPEEPVAIGDTWPWSFTKSMQMGSMTMDVTNKLESVEGSIVTISQEIAMKLDTSDEGPVQMSGEVTQGHGMVVLDLSRVLPREANIIMDMDIQMTHPEGKLDMAVKSETSLTRSSGPEGEGPAEGRDDGDN